jgi:hypothetical protein
MMTPEEILETMLDPVRPPPDTSNAYHKADHAVAAVAFSEAIIHNFHAA